MIEKIDKEQDKSQENEVLEPIKTVIPLEMNFLRYPYFTLTRSTDMIEYRETINVPDGVHTILWRVTANIQYGLPTQFDKEVHRVIEKTVSEQEFPIENPLPIPSLSDFCRFMRIARNGRNMSKIKESLYRLRCTSIESYNTFQNKTEKGKRYVNDTFSLYDRIILIGMLMPDGETIAERNYVVLSEAYLENINAFYIRLIDYEYWLALKFPIAQRLYELLGPTFYAQRNSRKPVRLLYTEFCRMAPIAAYDHLSRIKQQLGTSVSILINTGYLDNLEIVEHTKDGWLLLCYPGPRVRNEMRNLKFDWEVSRKGNYLPEGYFSFLDDYYPIAQTDEAAEPIKPPVRSKAAEKTLAYRLVQVFYAEKAGLEETTQEPMPKELELSERLIRDLSLQDDSDFVSFVKFVLERARASNFAIQNFGGVRQYESLYQKYREEQKIVQNKVPFNFELEAQLVVKYRRHRQKCVDVLMKDVTGDTLANLRQNVEEEYLAEFGRDVKQRIGEERYEHLVGRRLKRAIEDYLIETKKIQTYDEWREEYDKKEKGENVDK